MLRHICKHFGFFIMLTIQILFLTILHSQTENTAEHHSSHKNKNIKYTIL